MLARLLIQAAITILLISTQVDVARADYAGDDFGPGAGADDGSILNAWYDSDGDGLLDLFDTCPFEWGEDVSGCPLPPSPVDYTDSDGDGVLDTFDLCPDEAAGTFDGCPEQPAEPAEEYWEDADDDGDGLSNGVDNCPDTFGDPSCNGCACPPEPVYNEEPSEYWGDDWPGYADA